MRRIVPFSLGEGGTVVFFTRNFIGTHRRGE